MAIRRRKNALEWLMRVPASRQLIERIEGIPADTRRFMPFPEEWVIDHQLMILMIDAGFLGMDGFKYCFREMAEQCRRVCAKAR